MNELDDFDFDDSIFEDDDFVKPKSNRLGSRYSKAKKHPPIKNVKFKHAVDLAESIDFDSGDRFFCIVDGSFIFGDFIEAFIVKKNVKVLEMTVETLSMSQENVDSLRTLIEKDYIDELNLIVSDYFYSHERNNLIPYIYQELDIKNSFQLAVCRTHRKIIKFVTSGGKHIVIQGSANLRSSDNIESFSIEDSKELYDFDKEVTDRILERYSTINKSIKSKELWHLVAKDTQQ